MSSPRGARQPALQTVAAIHWRAPWLACYAIQGEALFASMLEHGLAIHAALNRGSVAPMQFVATDEVPPGQAYEAFIHATGRIPTRGNAHDFFNGLVWLHFPQSKQQLNQLQAQAMAAYGVGAARGPLRDALTLFDESGALLDAPAALWQALVVRDWKRLFVDLRPLWHQSRLVLFGHALLEKLLFPRKAIVAHVYKAQVAIKSIVHLDTWLANELQSGPWIAKPFAPLPVLGVPGWWPPNENAAFYEDAGVFRTAPRMVNALK